MLGASTSADTDVQRAYLSQAVSMQGAVRGVHLNRSQTSYLRRVYESLIGVTFICNDHLAPLARDITRTANCWHSILSISSSTARALKILIS